PRVCSSIIASSLSTSWGSDSVIGLRPAPGRRIRPPHVTPASISRIPLRIAFRDKPHARRTRLTPPWPKALASLAAVKRRVRSSNRGQIARNFAVSSARVFTLQQHKADKCSCPSPFLGTFIYLRCLSHHFVAAEIGCEASSSFGADTVCPDSIHFGATSRSS